MTDIIEIIPTDFSEESIQKALEDKILLDSLNGVKDTRINDVLDSIVRKILEDKNND